MALKMNIRVRDFIRNYPLMIVALGEIGYSPCGKPQPQSETQRNGEGMESSIKTGYYRAFLLFLIGKILTNHSRECIKSAIFDIISPL